MTGLLHDHLTPIVRTDENGNMALEDVQPFLSDDGVVRVVAPDGSTHFLRKTVWVGYTRLTTYDRINYYKSEDTGETVYFDANAVYLVQGWEAPYQWRPGPEQEFAINTFQVKWEEEPTMAWTPPTERLCWKISHHFGSGDLRTAVLCRSVPTETTSCLLYTSPSPRDS